MNRIDKRFKELQRARKKAFIPYICAGDPDLSITRKLVIELEAHGADIIELGVPFSDPLADGPTIQRASQRALKAHTTLKKIFLLVRQLRKETQIPVVLMLYYNRVYTYGVEKFVRDATLAGVDGCIVPDLAIEEASELIRASRKRAFDTIFLVAPTSTKMRIRHIADCSRGFIYYVSLTGVTGARQKLPSHIRDHINTIKRMTKKPICVGFGVSTPSQVKEVSRYSDGVIVGSALINVLEKNLSNRRRIPSRVGCFAGQLIKGIR